MLLEVLKENFEQIFVCDAEFICDKKDKGERPNVVCFVFKEIISGKTYKHYEDSLKELPPHKPKKTLFVAYNVNAEASCIANLKIKMPIYWWDCFIENQKLYRGRINGGKGAFSMLRTAKRYGIECMSEDLKKWNISQILNNPEHKIEDTLDYCEKDVIATEKLFYEQLKDIERTFANKGPREIIQHALIHGRSMAYTAIVEHNGIPIDNELLDEINNNFPVAKEKIIEDINSRLDVYENGSLSNKKFKSLVARLGLLDVWPKTPSGQLSTTDKVIYKFAQQNEAINEFYFLKEFVDSQKLKGFIVGPDGRARTDLNMFGTATGRTNQSTSRYPFNTAKPMRNIIKPNMHWALVSGDWKSQEVYIAAHLSKDQTLMDMLEEEDIYIQIAIKAGALPKGSIRNEETESIRNKYKTVLLGLLYGRGAKSLREELGITHDEAVKIIHDLKTMFSTYFAWINDLVNMAYARGYMSTKFGWRYWIGKEDKINPRTLSNFPIQAHGSEMLRLALIDLTEKGFEVNGLIHDGIMIHVPLVKLNETELKFKQIMENASRLILDGKVCPADTKVIRSNFKQGKEEQKKFERMISIIRDPSNRSTPLVA